jgi:hypothetical protein
MNTAAFKLTLNFEKTNFRQQTDKQTVMNCRREDGETYRLRFNDQQICLAVYKHCDEAKVVMVKKKCQVGNLIKVWLPADEGPGCQTFKTFKILPDDTIRSIIEDVRAKMAIEEDEMLRIAIEGPIHFQPGLEELVAAHCSFQSAGSAHIICRL